MKRVFGLLAFSIMAFLWSAPRGHATELISVPKLQLEEKLRKCETAFTPFFRWFARREYAATFSHYQELLAQAFGPTVTKERAREMAQTVDGRRELLLKLSMLQRNPVEIEILGVKLMAEVDPDPGLRWRAIQELRFPPGPEKRRKYLELRNQTKIDERERQRSLTFVELGYFGTEYLAGALV